MLGDMVGTRTPVAGGPTRGAPKRGRQTETLVLPYVINQTLVQGWIWAFQVKGYLLVQESALYNEVLLLFLGKCLLLASAETSGWSGRGP